MREGKGGVGSGDGGLTERQKGERGLGFTVWDLGDGGVWALLSCPGQPGDFRA